VLLENLFLNTAHTAGTAKGFLIKPSLHAFDKLKSLAKSQKRLCFSAVCAVFAVFN
jgi:hypothetical protein